MTLYRSCSLRNQVSVRSLLCFFKWMNLILVYREFKKNNEPDVIREAKYELNVSTSVFFSGFELNCQYNTKKELQHTVKNLPCGKWERMGDNMDVLTYKYSHLIWPLWVGRSKQKTFVKAKLTVLTHPVSMPFPKTKHAASRSLFSMACPTLLNL